MFVCDVVLANQDRHCRNFGFIRNIEFPEYTRTTPVYDTGASLWYDQVEWNVCPIIGIWRSRSFGDWNGRTTETDSVYGVCKRFRL